MPSTAANAGLASSAEKIDRVAAGDRSSMWLWAAVVVGTVLRLIDLGRKSFWLDEIASVAIARRSSPVFWHFLWHDEGNMAAYYVVLRPWLHLGYGEATVRLLSVIAGVISIPMMYVLARRLFARDTALLATIFFALNTCAISVSQEARAYSWLVLLVLLSTWLFVRMVERPTSGRSCAYALVAGLTFYFQYFGVLVPAVHAVSLVALPRGRRPWKALGLVAMILVVVAVPILWLIHAQDVGHIAWVGSPSWLEFYHLGAFLAADSGKAVGGVLLALDLVLVGIFFAKFRDVLHGVDAEERWRYVLVASMVATPILITLLASIIRPAFYHRFLIVCLPGWVLMTALGAQRIGSRIWRGVAIGAVCALSLVSTVLLYQRPGEDWRGVAHYLAAHTEPADRVLYYESVGEFGGESYRDWLPGGDGPRPLAIGVNAPDGDWQQKIQNAPRVWLVLYRTNAEGNAARAIEQVLAAQYQQVEWSPFEGVTVLEYSRR